MISSSTCELIENELKVNLLKPREYAFLAMKLIEDGYFDLATLVLKTGIFLYPKNKQLLNVASSNRLDITLPEKPNVKVFGIGLSRTGTNSLSHALKKFNLSGYHWFGSNTDTIVGWDEIVNADYASDTCVSFIFETLYYAYPDACFIYTVRDKNSWIKSMENHFKWAGTFNQFQDIVEGKVDTNNKMINQPLWSVIHKNLYTNFSSWSEAYQNYEERVETFFSKHSKATFVRLAIEWSDEKKWSTLSKVLSFDFIPLAPFPRMNQKLNEFNSSRDTINKIIEPLEKLFQEQSQIKRNFSARLLNKIKMKFRLQ